MIRRMFFTFFICLCFITSSWILGNVKEGKVISLPDPSYKGEVSVEEVIKSRRTVRSFRADPLTLSQLSQLLWAAQGITDERKGLRSAPSGGALYPLDVYVSVGEKGVIDLPEGIYRYLPQNHKIEKITEGDRRREIAKASVGQNWMAQAPVIFVITAEYSRITKKYGNRGQRYAHIEVGHVGQNIFLQAEAIGLGAGIVGAFNDQEIAKIINAMPNHEPLIIMPVGYKK